MSAIEDEMRSPIHALQHNIVWAFENPNGSAVESLRSAVERGLLTPVLDLDTRPMRPLPPRATKLDDQPAQIVLHSVYLEMVWAWIYGWIVIYEESVQREWIAGRFDGRIVTDTPLKVRATQLIDWSASLRDAHNCWPNGLPSPCYWESEREEFYALRANGIYQSSVAYLLYHEFAHIRQGHFGVLDDIDTDEQRAIAIQMEREADDFAFSALVGVDDEEDIKRLKAWAILAATLTALQLVRTPAGLFQGRHPHLHHRVYEMLTRLNFRDIRWRGYYGYLANTILGLTLERVGGDVPRAEPRVFDTVEDAEIDILERIDAFDPLRR
jgi:hypothetical protein